MEPIAYMQLTRELYASHGYAPYGWRQADSPPPFVRLAKPLSECRLGMLGTAGAYVMGQVAYYYKDDTSYRAIPKDTPSERIHFSHITENYLPDPRRDANCVFPIDALRALEAEGVIGSLADNLFSCMGGVYSQRRVEAELIPALTAAFQAERVDAVLLVPMCPVCHQTACMIARHLEGLGILTICMGSAFDILKAGRPPRASFVDFPLGHSSGKPFDRAGQIGLVRRALAGLESACEPESFFIAPDQWDADEQWKADTRKKEGAGGEDQRKPRDTVPQYQTDEDRKLAEAALAV